MSRGHIFTRERGGGDRGRGSYIDEGAHHIPSEVCFALFLFWNRSNWIRKIRQRFKTISRCFAFICKTKVSQLSQINRDMLFMTTRKKKGYGISQFFVMPRRWFIYQYDQLSTLTLVVNPQRCGWLGKERTLLRCWTIVSPHMNKCTPIGSDCR